MSESRWFRFGEWMAVTPLRRWVLRYDGVAPRGLRFINRINGHVVVLAKGDQ